MKKIPATLVLLIIITSAYAQQYFKRDTARLDQTVVSLSLIVPGVTYETALTDKTSLFVNLALGFAYERTSTLVSTTEAYTFNPTLLLQYRSYYNLQKRQFLGRKIAYNTGSYVGVMGHYVFDGIAGKNRHAIEVNNDLTLGPVWGFQRNGFLSFGLSLGVGVTIGQSGSSDVGPIGHLNFGFNLSRRQKDKE